MYAEERQQAILELARRDGRVEVTSLAENLAVTAETIRRDLGALERHGLLRRVHGGAIPVERLGFEPRLAEREERLVEEKQRIAKRALEELPDEGAILLDAGSTTAHLAAMIPDDRELTVVTNALPVASALAGRSNIVLHLVGGRVRGRTLAAVDDWAQRELSDIYVDVAFLGTNGISTGRGLTTADLAEAAVKRAMVAAARRVVVLADHTKFGDEHFARFAELSDVDLVVSDAGLDPALAETVESAGPEVARA